MSDIEFKDKGLKQLMKAFKRIPVVQIGILGSSPRTDGGQSNAAVGAAHEFGTSKLPRRSFLREPITDHLDAYLQKAGAFDKAKLNEVVKNATLKPYMDKVAIVCEEIVQDAFGSGGFGKWKPSDMTDKKVQMTLVETQQLRRSITSKVVDAT